MKNWLGVHVSVSVHLLISDGFQWVWVFATPKIMIDNKFKLLS